MLLGWKAGEEFASRSDAEAVLRHEPLELDRRGLSDEPLGCFILLLVLHSMKEGLEAVWVSTDL